jgi:hypothetical protein
MQAKVSQRGVTTRLQIDDYGFVSALEQNARSGDALG